MTIAIVISGDDNVATALEAIERGQTVRAGATVVTAADPIPRGHKIALRAIPEGGRVIKYGSPIGTASREIAVGAHVHTHNVASARGRGDLSRPSADLSPHGADLSRHSAAGATAEGATADLSRQSAEGAAAEDATAAPRLAEPAE